MQKLYYHKTKFLLVPQSIDELSSKQFIAVAKILHSEMPELAASLKALQVLTNKNYFNFLRIRNDVKLNCLEYVQWVFEELKFSKQLLPKYKGYYGPKSELDNLTLAEFYFSELYYGQLVAYNNEDDLNKLVAILYRKGKWFYNTNKDKDGDIRCTFNGNSIDYYAGKIKRWPLAVKQAIMLWYDGCRKQIANDNPEIFNGDGDNNDNEADMFGILRGLAGGKYGDFEKVEKMLLHTALLEMQFSIADNKRLEAAYKKQ